MDSILLMHMGDLEIQGSYKDLKNSKIFTQLTINENEDTKQSRTSHSFSKTKDVVSISCELNTKISTN